MNSGEWKAVWDAAAVAYAHQPIEVRVGMALVAAFLVLMVLEGLRANFVPQRKARVKASSAKPAPPPPAGSYDTPATYKPAVPTPQAQMATRAFAPVYGVAPQMIVHRALPATRKRETTRPCPYRSVRPKIRRASAAIHGERGDTPS